MQAKFLLLIAALALSVSALTGCSGGGGGGAAPAVNAFNRGVISAPGTVVVNGVFYNLSGASITIDGTSGKPSDLQVGMVVSVKGIFDNRTSHAIRRKAISVDYTTSFQGPVDCVNPLNNTLTIMGQQVVVSTTSPNQTVFANFNGSNIVFANASTVAKLNPQLSPQFPVFTNITTVLNPQPTRYSVVKVSGFSYIIPGTYGIGTVYGFQATRVELVSQNVDLSTNILLGIRGIADNVDPIGMSFTIGNMSFDYSQLLPAYAPLHFTSGQYVSVNELSSNYTPGNAPSLTLVTRGSLVAVNGGVPAQNGDHVAVAGFVNYFDGTNFTVNGTAVNGITVSLNGVNNGTMVEVEGTVQNGVLIASSLTVH